MKSKATTSGGEVGRVFYAKGAPGRVYVQARNSDVAYELCKDSSDLYLNNVSIVPLEDIQQLLSMRERDTPEEGWWIRIRRGKYKGDIGQVVELSNETNQLTVKVVPRMRRGKPKEPKRQRTNRATRPIAMRRRYMDIRKEMRDEVKKTADGFEYEGEQYDKMGFILMKIDDRDIRRVWPTLEEISTFVDAAIEKVQNENDMRGTELEGRGYCDEDIFKAGNIKVEQLSIPYFYSTGDKVRITVGNLAGLTGLIKERLHSTVVIEVFDEKKTRAEVEEAHVMQILEEGDAVEILYGIHAGRSGLIVHVDETTIEIQEEGKEYAVRIMKNTGNKADKKTLDQCIKEICAAIKDTRTTNNAASQ